jgi:DNA-binding transcriptional regulator YhcF (GntR family)
MALDPEDPRPPYQQVANSLRAAILTRKFSAGDKLPSQSELATHYGVARMTIQQALRILREESLIVSRAGSGVFVRERTERPVGLRPHVEAAFEQDEVRIDFSGYTAETLHGVVQEPLDKIRAGRLRPQRLHVRMLLADLTQATALPSRAGDDPGDDPRIRERMAKIAARHSTAIVESVRELAEMGLVDKASAEVRVIRTAPLFKVYIVNMHDLFFGFYPVLEHAVAVDGGQLSVFDPMGKDTVLFHHAADVDPDSTDAMYVAEAVRWFDSVWNTIARAHVP